MKLIGLLIAIPVVGFAITCPSGSTSLSSTVGGGNASVGTSWVGGVAPASNANGYCLTLAGPITLDTDWGTSAGTGIYTIIQTGVGSLTVNNAVSRHIYFASTGSNPIGTGSAANPDAGATMYGFFFPKGTLNLTGSQSNPLTITSANGINSWYIAANTTEAGGGLALTLKWCNCSFVGTNTNGFYGIYVDTTSFSGSETIDLENNQFTNYYQALYVNGTGLGSGKLILSNDTYIGRSGPETVFASALTNPIVTNNTESGILASGKFASFNALSGSSISYQQNAIFGSSSFAAGNLVVGFSLAATGGAIAGNLTYNDAAQTGNIVSTGIILDTVGIYLGTVDSNYCELCYQAIYNQMSPNNTLTVSNNFATSIGGLTSPSAPSQGIFFNDSGNITLSGNFGMYVSGATIGSQCLFVYNVFYPTSAGTSVNLTLNTCGVLAGLAGNNYFGLNLGDDGIGTVTTVLVSKNLTFGYQFGLYDWGNGTTSPGTSFVTSCTGGVGICQNNIYGSATPYTINAFSTNAGTGHPNPTYGDISAKEPEFLDPSRYQISTYETRVLGGTGNLLTQLGFRNGLGGSYVLSSTPITDMVNWDRLGWTPGNGGNICTSVQVGMAPCIAPATAMSLTQ